VLGSAPPPVSPPGSALPPPGSALPPPGSALPPPGSALPPPGSALPPPGSALPPPLPPLSPPPGPGLPPPGSALPPPLPPLLPPGSALPPPLLPPVSGITTSQVPAALQVPAFPPLMQAPLVRGTGSHPVLAALHCWVVHTLGSLWQSPALH